LYCTGRFSHFQENIDFFQARSQRTFGPKYAMKNTAKTGVTTGQE
jgi:hypothetical protein